MKSLVLNHYFYICLLSLSTGLLLLADYHLRLVFFYRAVAAAKTIGSTMVILLGCDLAGIGLRIFSTNQRYVVGWYIITPNLPIEEVEFLFLLCYVTLLLYVLLRSHRGSGADI